MPPGGDNGDRPISGPPHLRLVGSPGAPAGDATPEPLPPPPDSGPQERIVLPPRFTDSSRLHQIIDGQISPNPFESFRSALAELANPRPGGGYDAGFTFRNTRYQLTQADGASPIELLVTREAGGNTTPILKTRYLPDGSLQSIDVQTGAASPPHPEPVGPEVTHHRILMRSILAERAQRIMLGQDVYVRLRTALEALRGRYTPENQSVWYDNFVVNEGAAYTFRIRNLLGLPGIPPNPQTSQISIYEDRGSERIKILTLSATGENNWEPSRPEREPLSPARLELLKRLALPLERARENPAAYQQQLHPALRRITPQFEQNLPQLAHSVDIPRTFGPGRGLRNEPILEMRTGKDLFFHFHPWAGHRWVNPENSQEVRRLTPRVRLSLAMGKELMRWMGRRLDRWTFGKLSSPQANSDLLRLQLFPEGGGQLTTYRDGNIHDILIAEARGPLWRASREIRRMERRGTVFENRLAGLQAAVAARTGQDGNALLGPYRSPGQIAPAGLHVQEAPYIDLDQIHLLQDGNSVEIRDVETAWRMIQRQIPEGVHPRVQSSGPRATVDRIHVDFRESQPLQQLDIRHFDMPPPTGEGKPTRRVEIVMRSGENTHARVFEDGVKRPDIARDIHRRLLLRAQEGNLPVSRLALGAQAIPRIWGYYKVSGGTFALSYFIALPFTLGVERLMLNEEQRRLYGTPMPHFSLSYYYRDFFLPFATMSTASGVTGVLIDGAYNMRPGLANTYRMWRAGASLTEAWRLTKPNFFNEFPNVRPIGRNLLFRGFLQRALPLFAGLVGLEYLHHGEMSRSRLLRTGLNVGVVSAGSAGLLRAVYSSSRLSATLQRWGLAEDTLRRAVLAEEVGAAAQAGRSGMTRVFSRVSSASRSSRMALTFRGGVVIATLELIALSVLAARDKRELFNEAERGLRQSVGHALDRRNELITRLEHGEEVPPRILLAADQELETAQASYRRFLEIAERSGGRGDFRPLTLENEFEDAYRALERERVLTSQLPPGSSAAFSGATVLAEQERRLVELRNRSEGLDRELTALYRRHGAPEARNPQGDPGLREFLRDLQAGQGEGGTTSNMPPPARSPISVDSPEGQAIVEQLRWKVAQDPAFFLAGSEHQARYILRQFRGYQVREADGAYRPWNFSEAMAFLGEVDRANLNRARNLEGSLTLPDRAHYDTSRLDALFEEEAEIRRREMASHRYTPIHADRLANHLEDFDRQMEEYYRMSNGRLARALEGFMEMPLAATPPHPAFGHPLPQGERGFLLPPSKILTPLG